MIYLIVFITDNNMVNLFDFSKNQSTVPNATGYLSKFTPKPAPVLNFGAPMSGTTQFSESWIKQAPKPTAPTSGGFSLVPKANAWELDQAKIERFIQRWKDLWKSRDEIKMAYDKALQQWLFNVWWQQPTQPQDINDLSLWQELIQRGKNLWQDFTRRAWEVSQSFTRQTSDNPLISAAQPLGTALKTAWSVVWAWFDVLWEWIAFITPDVVKEWLSDAWKAIWDKTPEVVKQTAITAIKEGWEAYKDFKQNNPFLADALEWSWNIAWILPVWYGAKATWKWVVKWAEKISDTTNTLWKSIEAKWENFRNAIAWLDEKEVMALKNTPREEWEWIINQARLAKDNDYLQTPYNEWAKKANDAFKQLEQNLETSQKARVETLKNSWIEKIETWKVRQDIVKDIEDTFNIQWVNIVDGKIKYKTTPGRESLLREENIKDYEALKLLENATKSRTPLQMMDNIKKMQSLIYESTDWLRVSKDMSNLIKRSIGKLNQSFKEQVWWNYANILDDMAQDIRIKNELVKIFKASSWEEALNRWELAMKRLANWTTTSAEARQLALLVKERTWIDLIKEARLRQLAMDLVDDTRWATLFWSIERWPKWILDYSLEKAKKLTPFDKEKTALARTLKPKKLKNGNNTNSSNTTSNTSNKQTNTNSSTKNTPLISKSNNTPLKSTSITTQTTQKEIKPRVLSERENKLLKPVKTQLETTLKWATTSNIDEVTQSVAKTLKTTKTAEIKEIIQRYLKEFWKDFKNKIGDMIDEITKKTK